MDPPSHDHQQPIVVIEPDADLARIVALTLRQQNRPVVIYRSLAEAWEDARAVPALVVLDAGPAAPREWSALDALERHPLLGAAPVVSLAWACDLTALPASSQNVRLCLAKPFDARALDEAVTTLLSGSHTAATPSSPRVAPPDDAPEGNAASSSPSVWPLVTAAGGFIAVVGFMIHPAYAVAGLLVMVASLLRWALEPANSHVHT